MDIFDTRTMLEAVEERHAPRTFLLNSFFPTARTFGTESVDIDIVKGKRRLAPFVSPLHEGKVVATDGYTTESFKPPYIKPKKVTSAGHYLKRMAGEAVYVGSLTPQQRALRKLGEDLQELNDQITRREEWMAAQALTTGKVHVQGEGVDVEIDFKMAASHNLTLSAGALWTHADSDPVTAMRGWKRLTAQDSGFAADRVIIGANVVDPLYEKLKAKLDTRRMDLGMINPQELPNGVTYLGWLADPGVDLYTYDEWFVGGDGDEHPMVPVDRIIMGSTRADTVRAYGAIQDEEAIMGGLVEAQRFPKTWVQKDPSVRFLMLQSAALVIPKQIGAFLTAKVV